MQFFHLSRQQNQILLFIIAGGFSAMLEIGSMKIFSSFLPMIFPLEPRWHGVAYPLSNIFSSLTGIISNYFFSIWFVFQTGKYSKKKEFTYFMMVSLLSTVLSLAAFNLFFHFVQHPINLLIYMLSPVIFCKLAAIVFVSILNFIVKKRIIFNS